MSRPAALLAAAAAGLGLLGCASVPNQYREDGPATRLASDSPTAERIKAEQAPAEMRRRDWGEMSATADSGVVTHFALYMEDPFVDKGHGRSGENVYRLGWEDYVALAYCYPRHTLNWLGIPFTALVQPPWTIMESDGEISKQALGYDHDAAETDRSPFEATPETE